MYIVWMGEEGGERRIGIGGDKCWMDCQPSVAYSSSIRCKHLSGACMIVRKPSVCCCQQVRQRLSGGHHEQSKAGSDTLIDLDLVYSDFSRLLVGSLNLWIFHSTLLH